MTSNAHSPTRGRAVLIALALLGAWRAPTPGAAQTTDPIEADPEGVSDVVVVQGRRVRGRSLSAIEPELTLTEEDIAAYGVSTLGELLEEILAETSSGRGRSEGPPVVLLNGRRISGFREIGRYPVEALARVEVLPEEASLSYGFSADQRVINFILKPNITVNALEGAAEAPEEGGSTAIEGSGQRLFVDGDTRLSLDAEGGFRPPILESERDVVFAGDPSVGELRTLLAERDNWSVGFSAGRGVMWDAAATLSGSFQRTTDDDFLGTDESETSPAEPAGPLDQLRRTDDLNLGFSLVSALAPTTWNLTANYNVVDVDTETEFNVDGAGGAPALSLRSTSSERRVADIDFVVNSKLKDLSAGSLAVTGQVGYSNERQEVTIDEAGGRIGADASRDTISGRFSIDAPIIAPGPIPGDVTLNGNIEVEDLSDFGTLLTYGYGLTWKPVEKFRIIASTTVEEGAPSLGAVGDPTIITPAVRVFDFAAGADTFIDTIDGGNPDLVTDDRRVIKVGLQLDPIEDVELRFNVDYTRSRIENETRVFPLLTEEFEEAFPDRVLRDATGALVSFDRRPVVAAETRRQELRSGVNWSKRLKRRRVRQTGRTKRRRSGRPGRIRIGAYHRWNLQDEVTIAEGLPAFDFLNGSASGRLGGSPRHLVDASMYRWNNGLGAFLGVTYQTATEVDSPDGPLRFSDLFLTNARVTYEFNYSDRILNVLPFLEETRLSFTVRNVFDDKVQVTDEAGATPLSFQEDILDPFGRTWRIELRRRF